MQEQHGLAVRADLRIAVTQHASAFRNQRISRGDDLRHLVADVMDAAVRIALDKFRYRLVVAERLDEFDIGVG